MKIAYVIPSFPVPTETFAVSDVNALADLGHEVEVHALRPLSGAGKELLRRTTLRPNVAARFGGALARTGVCARNIPALLWVLGYALKVAVGDFKLGLTIAGIAPRIVEIAAQVADGQFAVVHAFWGRHPSLVLAILKRFWPGRCILSVFVGAYDLVADDSLVRLGLASADVRFTHAAVNLPYFQALGCGDVHLVRRGMPVDDFSADTSPRRDVVITASALDPSKNVDLIIKSFFELAKSRPGMNLEIAGAGSDLPRLKEIVRALGMQQAVSFLGHISRADLFKRMSTARLFVFLSEKPSERHAKCSQRGNVCGLSGRHIGNAGDRRTHSEPGFWYSAALNRPRCGGRRNGPVPV